MKINLYDMIFYGHHGVHPEERKLGQRFIVNFSFRTDDKLDQSISSIDDTIDYTQVYDIIKDVLEKEEFHLLENCANVILDKVMDSFKGIISSEIKIQKPSVPIKGSLRSVEVEMLRKKI